jgi:AcrR family transcriptional regulator
MAEIATAAGVSKGLPYAYFRSKEDLLRSALEDRLDHLLALTDVLDRHVTARRKLAALAEGLLRQIQREPAAFRLYLSLTLQEPTPRLRRAFSRIRARLNRYLEGIETLFTELGSKQPQVDAVLFRSAILGIGVRVARASERIPTKALLARLLETLAP